MSDPAIIIEVDRGVARIELNSPRTINALTLAMVEEVTAALTGFAADADVERVVLSGAGERGLCAGADVRAVRSIVLAGGDPTEFFTKEYGLHLLVATFPKPYTAVMNGITMGGGLGLSAHGSDRVVTPTSRLAMPETQIGFFPDALMTWRLSRMPGEVGTHLAMTGEIVGAADALWLGLADRSSADLPEPTLEPDHAWIGQCYRGSDVVEIHGRLSEHSHPAARAAARTLEQRCPLSVHVALEAVRRAALASEIAEVEEQDVVVAVNTSTRPDFAEGVRAQLVDKDRSPRWIHRSLAEVDRREVEDCFKS